MNVTSYPANAKSAPIEAPCAPVPTKAILGFSVVLKGEVLPSNRLHSRFAVRLSILPNLDEHHSPVGHDDLSRYVVRIGRGKKRRNTGEVRRLRRKAD